MSSQIMLNDKTKEMLDYICKRDNKEAESILAFLITDYYNRIIDNDDDFDVYKAARNLRGSGWEGNLEESRS